MLIFTTLGDLSGAYYASDTRFLRSKSAHFHDTLGHHTMGENCRYWECFRRPMAVILAYRKTKGTFYAISGNIEKREAAPLGGFRIFVISRDFSRFLVISRNSVEKDP